MFQLLLMVVALSLATPVKAKGYNRLTQFKVSGGATLMVTIARTGKPQQRLALCVPSANIELPCRRSGYRPNQIIYGVAPLNHAVKLGRARAQSFPVARLRRSTKRAVFPNFSFRERGPKSRRVLANLEAAAWKNCSTGVRATRSKLNLAVAVRCKRVKGFGAR